MLKLLLLTASLFSADTEANGKLEQNNHSLIVKAQSKGVTQPSFDTQRLILEVEKSLTEQLLQIKDADTIETTTLSWQRETQITASFIAD